VAGSRLARSFTHPAPSPFCLTSNNSVKLRTISRIRRSSSVSSGSTEDSCAGDAARLPWAARRGSAAPMPNRDGETPDRSGEAPDADGETPDADGWTVAP